MILRSVIVTNTSVIWSAPMTLPMTPRAKVQSWADLGWLMPNRETRTLSGGCNSPTVEAPIRDSLLTLPALGAAGIAPKAARRFAWRAASAEAAAVGFPAAPAANGGHRGGMQGNRVPSQRLLAPGEPGQVALLDIRARRRQGRGATRAPGLRAAAPQPIGEE